jgi:cytochrome d ubiquinol oxidase subunit I
VYARSWQKGRRDRYVRAALVVPLTVAALAAPVEIVIGDWAGRTVAHNQPVKLAAFEGLESTQRGAPLHLVGIEIPRALSLLAKHDPNAPVTGLDAVPPPDRPPVGVVRVAFQLMVVIGTALALFGAGYLFVRWRRRRLPRSAWFYRALVAAGPLSVVALIAGWTVTEVGRQPWIVYRTMRTSEAVTAAGNAPVAFVFLIVAYAALAAIVVWLLRRLARQPVGHA